MAQVTEAQLAEYTKCEEEALKLEREAKTYRDRQKQLADKFEEDLKESKRPSLIRHGYTFAWVNGSASVAWADEFLKECGIEKVNALKKAAAAEAKNAKMKILAPATPVE